MKIMIKTVLALLSLSASIGYASTIENLVLVCRGGMELNQISELTSSVEKKILEQLTSSNDNSISEQDIVKLVKGEVSQSNNNTDTQAFYLCIESMASSILSNKTEISGKRIQIKSSNSDGLLKTPIQISKSNKTRIVFQYAREEQEQYVIALRLINNFNAKDHKFYFKKKSAQLVGEDSGEEYKLESINGLGSTSQPSATVPAMGSKLIKFYFKIPSQQEPLTFSNAWGSAGEAGNLGMAITFTPKPMNITWLEVKAVNYEYSGLPQGQNGIKK